MSLNRITVQGRLCAAPELRQTQNGKTVANFTLAVDRDHNREETDFIDVVVIVIKSAARYLGTVRKFGNRDVSYSAALGKQLGKSRLNLVTSFIRSTLIFSFIHTNIISLFRQ